MANDSWALGCSWLTHARPSSAGTEPRGRWLRASAWKLRGSCSPGMKLPSDCRPSVRAAAPLLALLCAACFAPVADVSPATSGLVPRLANKEPGLVTGFVLVAPGAALVTRRAGALPLPAATSGARPLRCTGLSARPAPLALPLRLLAPPLVSAVLTLLPLLLSPSLLLSALV